MICQRSKEVTSTTVALTSEQVLSLATQLEGALSAQPPATPSSDEAFHYMSLLIVSFLTFLIPQR